MTSWLHRFLAKQFFGLQSCFWYICLNLIALSEKSTFCLFKTEFKAKKLFARNRCSPLRRAVHIMIAACFGKPFERGHKSKRCFFNSKNVGLSPGNSLPRLPVPQTQISNEQRKYKTLPWGAA